MIDEQAKWSKLYEELFSQDEKVFRTSTDKVLMAIPENSTAAEAVLGYVDQLERCILRKDHDGMLKTLDPHSSFLEPKDYSDMQQRQKGTFYGLGILVTKRNDQVTVITPLEGTPAAGHAAQFRAVPEQLGLRGLGQVAHHRALQGGADREHPEELADNP